MSRNFGWGTRDMRGAASLALKSQFNKKNMAGDTIAAHQERFSQFVDYAKENGVGRMERMTKELIVRYGQELAAKVENDEMKASYAQNLVSSINSVLNATSRGNWQSVSPTKDCNIPQRCAIRDTPTISRENAGRGIQNLRENGLDKQAAIANLALNFGLRSKEASLLDAKAALNEAQTRGVVSLSAGTKGGRFRQVTIINERQIESLKSAATVQGEARAVMPPDVNWKEWREGGLRIGREALQSASGGGYHEMRSSYACERYEALTGHPAPCNGGKIEDKQLDRVAREKIAAELGHGRIDVVSEYIGGRS